MLKIPIKFFFDVFILNMKIYKKFQLSKEMKNERRDEKFIWFLKRENSLRLRFRNFSHQTINSMKN